MLPSSRSGSKINKIRSAMPAKVQVWCQYPRGNAMWENGGVIRAIFTVLLCLEAAGCHKPAPKVVVPEVFRVKFETSQGDFVVEATRAWAPHGVDRFHELVRMRYFDEGRFYRVLQGFIAQFGVHRDFNVHATWRN